MGLERMGFLFHKKKFSKEKYQTKKNNTIELKNIYTKVKNGEKLSEKEREKYDKIKMHEKYDLKESYRQLKVEMENQRDVPQAQFFLKKEMETYKEYLEYKNKKWKIDWITLKFNEVTSDYGTNWFKPIIIIFIINFIFYISFVNLNNFEISKKIILEIIFNYIYIISHIDYSTILNKVGTLIGDFSKTFIPTNSIKDIFGFEANGIWTGLNFMKNLFMTSLIYQAIVAFRKFSRK